MERVQARHRGGSHPRSRGAGKVTTAPRLCAMPVLLLLAIHRRPVDTLQPQSISRATPASVGLASAPIEEATALLRRFVAERKIAGAVAAIARRGRIAYLES